MSDVERKATEVGIALGDDQVTRIAKDLALKLGRFAGRQLSDPEVLTQIMVISVLHILGELEK